MKEKSGERHSFGKIPVVPNAQRGVRGRKTLRRATYTERPARRLLRSPVGRRHSLPPASFPKWNSKEIWYNSRELQPAQLNPGGSDSSGYAARQIAVLRHRESIRETYAGRILQAALFLQRVGQASLTRIKTLHAMKVHALRKQSAAKQIQHAWLTSRTSRMRREKERSERERYRKKIKTLQRWRFTAWVVGKKHIRCIRLLQLFYKKLRNRWRTTRMWKQTRVFSVLTIQCIFRSRRAKRRVFELRWFQDAWRYPNDEMTRLRRNLITEERKGYQKLLRISETLRRKGVLEAAPFRRCFFATACDFRRVEDEEAERRAKTHYCCESAWLHLMRLMREDHVTAKEMEGSRAERILQDFDRQVSLANGQHIKSGCVIPQGKTVGRAQSSLWCLQGRKACPPRSATEACPIPRKRGVAFDGSCFFQTRRSDRITARVAEISFELWGPKRASETIHIPVRPSSAPPGRGGGREGEGGGGGVDGGLIDQQRRPHTSMRNL